MSNDTLLVSTKITSDVLAVVQRIKEEIHRSRDFDDAVIKREIVSAIRHYRGRRFAFNESTAQMLTSDGVNAYGIETQPGAQDGYPADLLKVDKLRITINSSIYTMEKKTIGAIRELNSSATLEGFPDWWAWYGNKIYLYPTPSQDSWIIDIDYLRDIGTPYYRYESGEWVFYDEAGNSLGDTWNSEWLDKAEELIRFRAKWGIYMNVILDYERAAAMKQAEGVALQSLMQDRDNLLVVSEATPWY